MQATIIAIAMEAVGKHKQSKAISEYVKKKCDEKFPTTTALQGVFQCISGQHFACCITHDTRAYIHLMIGRVHVVVFKSRDLLFDPNFKPKGRDAKKEGEEGEAPAAESSQAEPVAEEGDGDAEGEAEAEAEAPADEAAE